MPTRRFILLYAAPALLLLVVAVLPLMVGARTLFMRDVFFVHLPMKHAQAEAMRQGRVPLIDPYRGGGQPLLGNPNAVPLYPTNLLYLGATTLWAMNAHFWLHLLLAPLAMFWLGRAWGLSRPGAWAAGVAYGFSGWFLSHLVFYNLIAGVTLAPALTGAVLDLAAGRRPRRSLLAVGVLWALLLLSGDPSMAALALALAGSAVALRYGLRVPRAGRLALALGLGTLAALPQIVEFARILPVSFRGFYGYTPATRTAGSLDPRQLAEWLIPFFYGRPDTIGYGRFWGHDYYTGWQPFFFSMAPGVLALALPWAAGWRGRAVRWGWAMAAVGLFFALGRFNPIASALLSLPGADSFRYPVKLWLLAAAGGAFLAGAGLDRLLEGQRPARRRFLVALGVLALLLAAVVGLSHWLPGLVEAWQQRLLPSIYTGDFLAFERERWAASAKVSLLVALVAVLSLVLMRRRPAGAAAALLFVHALTQLHLQAPNFTSDEVAAYARPPAILREIPPDSRLVHGSEGQLLEEKSLAAGDFPSDSVHWIARRTHETLYQWAAARWGRRSELNLSAEGLDSFLAHAASQLVEHAPDDAARLRLFAAWGIDRVLVERPLGLADSEAARLLKRGELFGSSTYLYEVPGVAPEAAFFGRVERAPHVNRAVELLMEPGFDATRQVVIPGDGPSLEGEGGSARIVEEGTQRLVVEVDARSPGVLLVQRSQLPLYLVTVDGAPAEIVPANLYRMGLELPAGEHRVVIEADTRPFWVSSAVALAALAALLGLAWKGR